MPEYREKCTCGTARGLAGAGNSGSGLSFGWSGWVVGWWGSGAAASAWGSTTGGKQTERNNIIIVE